MTKEQMEEAVSEACELISMVEQRAFEPESRKGVETTLRRILENREAWLEGWTRVLTSEARILPDAELGKSVKSKLQSVEDGAEMLTKPAAIEYLRARNSLNHEPLRKVEQEWLDRIFIRERVSKAWVGLASVVADAEEQGIHVEEHLQAPCKCLDSLERKRRNKQP
jgi:hypothetical protein